MGGLRTVVNLVNNLIDNLQIKVPVALHLDHSRDVNFAKQAINLGFTSIMFDGSHLPFEENFELTNELIEYVKKNKKSIALEVELGTIGGQEDEIIGTGEITNISEASKIALLPISMLAIGINNIHGKYPAH
jgi:fructose-bisphosphate aldolase class II